MNKIIAKTILFSLCFFCLLFARVASQQTTDKLINPTDNSTNTATEENQTKAQKLSLQWNRDSIGQAIEIYQNDAEKLNKAQNKEKTAAFSREAGRLWIILGNKEKAKTLFNFALTLLKNQKSFAEESKIRSELSLIYLDEGDLKNSRIFFEQAIGLAEKTNDFAAQAAALYCAGEFYYFRNETTVSENYYRQSIEKWRSAGNPQGEGKSLLSLGYLYLIKSEFDKGLESFNLALSKFQAGNDNRGEALSYKAIGCIFNYLNENQKALESLNKAESLFPGDMDFSEKATLFNWFGKAFEDYGDWQLSLNYRLKAFNLFETDGNLYGQLATLPSLGKLSSLLNDDTSAFNYLFKAEKLARQFNDNYFLATVYDEIGNIYFKNQDFQNSLTYFNKALKLFHSRIYQRQIASINSKLGQIYQTENNLTLAEKQFSASIDLSRSVRDNFVEADTLYRFAKLSLQKSEIKDSVNFAKESVSVTESLYSEVLNSKLKSSYFSNVFDRYELYINLLMKMNKQKPNENFAIEALQAAEKSRARSLLENLSLAEADFTKDADAETVKREKEIRVLLNAKADKLTDLLSNKAEKSETDKISDEISELGNELETIKAKLKQQSPIYSAIKNPAPFDVGEFQRNVLDENSLLLEFSLGKDESYLWLIGKNEVSSYVLPPREEIESKIEKLRGLLKANELKSDESVEDFQKRIREAEIEYQSVAKELSNQLFGQIADKLAKNRLIIVPDGELHYFPIAALPQPNSATDEPILLTNETIYEPSAQTLTIFAKSQKQSAPTAKNLLVFSDPIFTSDDVRFSPENKPLENSNTDTAQTERFRFVESLTNLSRLAASKDESETIINIVGAASADNFSGFAATREKLLNLKTADYKIIHFATHGLTDEKRPELSGIVLSRFNEKGQKLNEFFRIQDIYGLNLNADLVVLSACETGIGKAVKGEGLMSLNNAFLQTGAKTVMSSLWKVEDSATLELMKNFYGAMKDKNLTPSESLRQAQIKLRENPRYKSPFYWAAFTVQGDFRNVPKISNGFGSWVYLLPIVPLALIGIYLYCRKNYSTTKP